MAQSLGFVKMNAPSMRERMRGARGRPVKGQHAKRLRGGRKVTPGRRSIQNSKKELLERLTRERDEAIEFQTAAREVLRIVASSSANLQRVFDAMLEKATALCAAKFGSLFLYDGKGFTLAADRNLPPAYAQVVRGQFFLPEANTGFRHMVESKTPLHVTDMFDVSYARGETLRKAAVELGGVRSDFDPSVGFADIYPQEITRVPRGGSGGIANGLRQPEGNNTCWYRARHTPRLFQVIATDLFMRSAFA